MEPTAEKAMNGLTENAFYFLRGAFQQLENDPKRSVIDFYAAVELFLKARLLGEHWSLIVASKPDFQQFKSGNFQSVTFNEAIERFQRVLDQPIPVDAIKAFDRVRKHRNRMVHFYHPEENPSAPSVIAIEQLKAWHHLNRLITGEWASKLPQVGADEKDLLEGSSFDRPGQSRLSCQIRVNNTLEGLEVTVAPPD